MKELNLRIVGETSLLTHNNQAANPFSVYSQLLKGLTPKKKKTDADFKEIARLEWESGLYLHEGVVSIPGANFDRCFWDGAKKTKDGVKWRSGAMVATDHVDLSYAGKQIRISGSTDIPNPELDCFYETNKHQAIVKVNNSQVLRTRPIFEDWSCFLAIIYDETILDDRTLSQITSSAGRLVGLCEMRPRMGRFTVETV